MMYHFWRVKTLVLFVCFLAFFSGCTRHSGSSNQSSSLGTFPSNGEVGSGGSQTNANGYAGRQISISHVYQETIKSDNGITSFLVRIQASNVIEGASIKVNGMDCTDVTLSALGVSCKLAEVVAALTSVVISNANGVQGVFNAVNVLPAPPLLSLLSITSGLVSGGYSITLQGTGFLANALIEIGSKTCGSVNIVSSNQATCIVPTAFSAGMVSVKITNPDQQPATLENGFSYTFSAPVITSLSPALGSLSGGQTITVVGSGFQPNTLIKLGGALCYTLSSTASQILCTTSSHAVGVVSATAENTDTQMGSLPLAFSYQQGPSSFLLNAVSFPVVGDGSLYLPLFAWSASGFASTYHLRVSSNNDCTSPILELVGQTATSYQVTASSPMDPGNYYLCVSAISAGGLSVDAMNNALPFTVQGEPFICDTGNLNTICKISSVKTVPNLFRIVGSGNLTIESGGVLRTASSNSNFTIKILSSNPALGQVVIQSGGAINANIYLYARQLSIESGGALNADGLGFGPEQGPGKGIGSFIGGGSGWGGGAGHGNTGSFGSIGGPLYDLAQTPTLPGSGGGNVGGYAAGGSGGGAIRLNVDNAVINGVVSANGTAGISNPTYTSYAGGGSGGSLFLTFRNSLSGSGKFNATGGDASMPTIGAGGRIALYAPRKFSGTVSVLGGNGSSSVAGSFYQSFTDALPYCDSVDTSGNCTISTYTQMGDGAEINVSAGLVISPTAVISPVAKDISYSFNVANGMSVQLGAQIKGNIHILKAQSLTVDGTLQANIGVDIDPNTKVMTANTANVLLGTLTINATGSITTDGLGYASGTGPGKGVNDYNNGAGTWGGGAGHGNAGGSGTLGGVAYGSSTQPLLSGSGGGSSGSARGGDGGGIIFIRATNSIINGALSSNGTAGINNPSYSSYGGGASGGSIFLITDTLSGSGSIVAKGGNSTGYPGAGGRIALQNISNFFSGSILATGGNANVTFNGTVSP